MNPAELTSSLPNILYLALDKSRYFDPMDSNWTPESKIVVDVTHMFLFSTDTPSTFVVDVKNVDIVLRRDSCQNNSCGALNWPSADEKQEWGAPIDEFQIIFLPHKLSPAIWDWMIWFMSQLYLNRHRLEETPRDSNDL